MLVNTHFTQPCGAAQLGHTIQTGLGNVIGLDLNVIIAIKFKAQIRMGGLNQLRAPDCAGQQLPVG
jgi:hypothetical protein